MELTIEQALQQGVAAHTAGKLQDAERHYRAILQSQPKHPDANHNLGVLAVSVNQAETALPLLRTALEANPKIVQFWLSYIDALIKVKQFGDARQVLEQAKKQGVAGEKLKVLEAQLAPVSAPENVGSPSPSQAQLSSLSEKYLNRKFSDAEKLARSLTQEFPTHQFGWKVLGALFKQTGRMNESLAASKKSVQLVPQDAEAHNNLGITLKELNRLEDAEASYLQAIALKPEYPEAHYNLGNTLKDLRRLDEAEVSLRRAIALKSDYAEAHNNLGNTLQELRRFDESEACYLQAIELKPGFAEFHYNLGITLKELGRLDEAEANYRQAIALKADYAESYNNLGIMFKERGRLDEATVILGQAITLKPDYPEAHNTLGKTLQELERFEEAVASFRLAIELKPDYALAHCNLGRILYNMGCEDAALEYIEKANHIDPQSKDFELLLSVLKIKKSREGNEKGIGDAGSMNPCAGLASNPLILNRVVEAELISNLYHMSARELDKTTDARYGKGICSLDFNLFEDSRSVIQKLAEDLMKIMREAVKSDVYVVDSFFNILGAGGGTTPHNHLNELDRDAGFGLGKKKYSLVYYLSPGDQNCSEPGILKLNDPVEEILPCEGMITIIPASREHSAIYNGSTDRVMIGVNFYSL